MAALQTFQYVPKGLSQIYGGYYYVYSFAYPAKDGDLQQIFIKKIAEFVCFGNVVDCLIIGVTLALHSESSQNVFPPEFKWLLYAV